MRRLTRLFALMFLVLATDLLIATPAHAFAIGTCPTDTFRPYHDSGHQYATGNYYGQFGWFVTYNMSVPHYTTAFSLSHLYSYYGSTSPTLASTWVEVGYYKGTGNTDYNSPHYYYAWGNSSSYVEYDSPSAPSTGSSRLYEVLFNGHNYGLGTDDWSVYWDGLSSADGTVHQPSMPNSHALAGGEVQGDSSSWTEMHTHGVANQQIILTSYTWHNWNTYFTSTTACRSAGLSYTENNNYMDFTITGLV